MIQSFLHLTKELNYIRTVKFYLSILAAEIPATYALNSIGMSFSNFILIKNYKANDLFLNYNFIIPLLFILLIVLFSGTIKKIIINKFN